MRSGGEDEIRGARMRILVVESFVLKKKRECEKEKEGAPVRGIEGRAPASLAPCNPLW
jgi:hypothetical protein